MPNTGMTLLEKYAIANKKARKHHLKTCIFINFSTYKPKNSIVANNY